MAEEFQNHFEQLMYMVDGVCAIVVSDREGVVVLQAKALNAPDSYLKPHILSTAPSCIEQASKLNVGPAKNIISVTENYQMVCFHCPPLTVTVLAEKDANTGHILAQESQLRAVAELMKPVIEVEGH